MSVASARHEWTIGYTNVVAVYSKRDDGQTHDEVEFRGDVEICLTCPKMMFRPHQKNLRPVEVVMEKTNA